MIGKCFLIWLACMLSFAGDYEVKADDLLRSSPTVAKVKAGEKVTLVLHNEGKLKRHAHNLVILKQGSNVSEFGNAAMDAESSAYVPASMRDKIVAATGLAQSGATSKVSFTAPAPGRYVMICSYPGHFSRTRAELVVE